MKRRLLTLLPLAALIAACANPQPTAAVREPATVAGVIGRDPQLSTFNGLLVRAGLEDQLNSAGPFTVFAPTNDAFHSMPGKDLDTLAHDQARLKSLLGYHVLATRLPAAQVTTSNARTMQGASVALARAGDYVTVDDAMVQTADLAAANGVVHTIDRVLMPPR